MQRIEELRSGQLAIRYGQYAGCHLILKIARDARDTGGRTGGVKARADLRHAFGNGDYRAERRDAMRLTQEANEVAAKPRQHALHVVILRIEGEDLLGLCPALLSDDFLKERLLGIEIDVERSLGDFGLTGDVAHACGIEALTEKHGAGTEEDLATLGAFLVIGDLGGSDDFHLGPAIF